MAAIRGLRNRWTKWRHGYITTELDGIEIRIGIVPNPEDSDAYQPTHWHATPATITIEGNDVYAEWDLIESPALEGDWSTYEPWWPRSYSLN